MKSIYNYFQFPEVKEAHKLQKILRKNECLHQLLIDIGKIKTTNLPKDEEKQAIEALELKYNEKITELRENGDNKIVKYVLFPLEN